MGYLHYGNKGFLHYSIKCYLHFGRLYNSGDRLSSKPEPFQRLPPHQPRRNTQPKPYPFLVRLFDWHDVLFSVSILCLHRDMYPVLVKVMQSVHRTLLPSDPLQPLQLQRIQALLSLLTQVTHTAGCHQELQAGMVR